MNITRFLANIAFVFCLALCAYGQNPADYGTLSVHLKADTLGLTDNAAVTNWNGLTVPGTVAGAAAPIFKASDAGFNGKPIVQFTSASKHLLTKPSANYKAQTIFAVVSIDASPAVSLAGLIGRGDDKLNVRRNGTANFYRSPGQGQDANDFSGVVTGKGVRR